jgi:hypothetical protein
MSGKKDNLPELVSPRSNDKNMNTIVDTNTQSRSDDHNDDGKSVQKTAIIVPFRDLEKEKGGERTKQMHEFIKYMHSYLGADGHAYKIFIVEQTNDGHKFNRGQLLNIGFILAESEGYHNFIFHDVDLLPSSHLLKYYIHAPETKPVHIASVWDRYGPNPKYFGGIVSFNGEMFKKINGYPNNFWGWGGEDDELYKRTTKFYKIEKVKEGNITDLENMNIEEKLEYLRENDLKFMLKREALALHEKTWKKNGLNSLSSNNDAKSSQQKYSILEKRVCGNKYDHCENILVDLDKTGSVRIIQSLSTVPAHAIATTTSRSDIVPFEESAKEPAKESPKEPAKESPKEVAKEVVKEPAKESPKEVAKEPAKESPKKATKSKDMPGSSTQECNTNPSLKDENVIISSFEDALHVASKYIKTQFAIDNETEMNSSYKNIKKEYPKFPDTANFPVWEMSIPALKNTLSYIVDYLNHSCYMLCVNRGCGKIYKLERKQTADIYIPIIKQSVVSVENNKTLSTKQKQTIKDKLTTHESKLRFMQCIVKEYSSKPTMTAEYVEFINNLKLPDGVFILNLTDAVILRKDGTHPFPAVVGEKVSIGKYAKNPFIPIFSISGQRGYYDITIPNYDDVMYVLNKTNVNLDEFNTNWQDKQTKAVFRGSPTGCGYTTETNQRLKLTTIQNELLDVGISGKGTTINTNSMRFDPVHGIGMLNTDIQPSTVFLPMAKQSEYKYIIHIDGNVNAYRLLVSMATGSLILRVESEYTSWVDHLIKDGKHYLLVKSDLSDLNEKIKYCTENDEKCKMIAEKGMMFARNILKYNTLRSIFQYILYGTMNSILVNKMIKKRSVKSVIGEEGEGHDDSTMPSSVSVEESSLVEKVEYEDLPKSGKCNASSKKVFIDGKYKCKKNKTAKYSLRDERASSSKENKVSSDGLSASTESSAKVPEKEVGEKEVEEKVAKVPEKEVGEKEVGEKEVGEKEVDEKVAKVPEKEVGEKEVDEKVAKVPEKDVGEKKVDEKKVDEKETGSSNIKEASVDSNPDVSSSVSSKTRKLIRSSVSKYGNTTRKNVESILNEIRPLHQEKKYTYVSNIPEKLAKEVKKIPGTQNFPWLIDHYDPFQLVHRIKTELPTKSIIDDHRVTFTLLDDTPSLATRAIQEEEILKTRLKHRTVAGEIVNMPSFWDAWKKNPNLSRDILNNKDPHEAVWKLAKKYNYKLATTFMPSYAKAIYDSIHAKKVLDPCAGWGDRLLGALVSSTVTKYVGFDPNKNLRSGYAKIAELAGVEVDTFTNTKLAFKNGFEIYSLPFEEGIKKFDDETFDFAFTSPPFFDYEMYNPDNPQYKDWIRDFYVPLFVQTCRVLKEGYYFGIHIGDTTAGKISDFLFKEVHNVSGFILDFKIGLMGVQSGKNRTVYMYRKVHKTGPVPPDLLPFSYPLSSVSNKYRKTTVYMPTLGNNMDMEKILNPPIIIRPIEYRKSTFHLIQDAQCLGGTKQRLLAHLLGYIDQPEIVYAGPEQGLAQVAIALCCALWGKRATIFLNTSIHAEKIPVLTRLAISLGANVNFAKSTKGRTLKQTEDDARKYCEKRDGSMSGGDGGENEVAGAKFLVPFGLKDEPGTVLFDTFKQALYSAIGRTMIETPPARVWIVAGSSFLVNVLASIWYSTEFHVVQVGKKIYEDQLIAVKHVLYKSEFKFAENTDVDTPYWSIPWYDAKLWKIVKQHGKDGDYIWNVGGVPTENEIKWLEMTRDETDITKIASAISKIQNMRIRTIKS